MWVLLNGAFELLFSRRSSGNYFLFMLLISVSSTFGRTPLLVYFGSSKLMEGANIFMKLILNDFMKLRKNQRGSACTQQTSLR